MLILNIETDCGDHMTEFEFLRHVRKSCRRRRREPTRDGNLSLLPFRVETAKPERTRMAARAF
jgi:hypothetical protein